MKSRLARTLGVTVLGVVVTALLGSCDSPSHSAGRSPGPAAVTSSRASLPTTAVPAVIAKCDPPVSGIVLTTQSGDGLALQLVYRNSGSTPCTLRGWPTVMAVAVPSKSQVAVPQSARSSLGPTVPVQTVTLLPGASASALVEWTAANTAGSAPCIWVGYLTAASPESDTSSRVARDGLGQACDLHVLPFVAGTSHDGYVLAPPTTTTLGLVVSHTRLANGWRVVLAPATRHTDGQFLAIPGRPTVAYDVPDPLVLDNGVTLVGPIEVSARGMQVTALAIVGG